MSLHEESFNKSLYSPRAENIPEEQQEGHGSKNRSPPGY